MAELETGIVYVNAPTIARNAISRRGHQGHGNGHQGGTSRVRRVHGLEDDLRDYSGSLQRAQIDNRKKNEIGIQGDGPRRRRLALPGDRQKLAAKQDRDHRRNGRGPPPPRFSDGSNGGGATIASSFEDLVRSPTRSSEDHAANDATAELRGQAPGEPPVPALQPIVKATPEEADDHAST